MKISSKQAFYALLASLVMSLVAIGFIMYWANSQLNTRSKQIKDKQLQSQELDEQTARAKNLRIELENLKELDIVSSQVLPSSKSQENIVGELLSLASRRGIELDSISFGGGSGTNNGNPEVSQAEQVKEISGVFSLTIQTSVQTDYENILQFLEDLETNKRQFEVTDISISPSTKIANLFDAQLTLVTYIQP